VLFYAVVSHPKAALGIATSNFEMTETKATNIGGGAGLDPNWWVWIPVAHRHEPWLPGW